MDDPVLQSALNGVSAVLWCVGVGSDVARTGCRGRSSRRAGRGRVADGEGADRGGGARLLGAPRTNPVSSEVSCGPIRRLGE